MMKKQLLATLLLLAGFMAQAQYGAINDILTKLEERRGFAKNLADENLDDRRFVLIKEFDDHTERHFIVLKGNAATYVEVFDDKATGQSTSNVFSGDYVRTPQQIISLRADKLEGRKIAMPITRTLLLNKQKKILYLIDVNTRERWIDEKALSKN